MTTTRWALAVAVAVGLAGLGPTSPSPVPQQVLSRSGRLVTDAELPAAAVACPRPGRPAEAAVPPASCPVVDGPAVARRSSAGSYALNRNADGSVTRWDPCGGSIHVRVNPGPGGRGAVADARTALAALRRATGLPLVYDGTTTFVPTRGNSLSQPTDLVVAWAPRGRTDWYGRGAVGEGGWRSSGTSTDGGRTWAWKITQGFVVIDPGVRLAPGFRAGLSRGALLLHELGHAVGLAHTGDTSQVMFPMLSTRSHASWGAGDAAGLRQVGAARGCVRAR